MPIALPSGILIGSSALHIMEPDRNWVRAPENHFWHSIPDEDISPPPYTRDDTIMMQYVHAPIPESRDEMARYVHVTFGLPDGMMYWRGDLLSDFPRYGTLDAADYAAWETWKASDEVQAFLDHVIVHCKMQATINREARDYLLIIVTHTEDGLTHGTRVIDNPLKGSH